MKHSGGKLHAKSRSGGHIKDKNRKFSHYTHSTLLYKPMFQELDASIDFCSHVLVTCDFELSKEAFTKLIKVK